MSFTPERIVLGIDFSDCSTAALRFARTIAARTGAEIVVVHAAQVFYSGAEPFTPALLLQSAFEQKKFEAEAEMRRYLAGYFEQVPTIEIFDLSPADAVLESAKRHRAELIVVGTRGRGGVSRLALGSTAERLLRHSMIPVITVRDGERPVEEIRRILCPVNYSAVAGKALDYASSVAEKFDAELTALHLIEDDSLPAIFAELDRLTVWVGKQLPRPERLRMMVHRGHPADQVLDFAAKDHTDLLVIGAQHRRFGDKTVIGSTTERVTRHAPCPVLTVPQPAVAEPVMPQRGRGAVAHD